MELPSRKREPPREFHLYKMEVLRSSLNKNRTSKGIPLCNMGSSSLFGVEAPFMTSRSFLWHDGSSYAIKTFGIPILDAWKFHLFGGTSLLQVGSPI
jgi:hypothetical protein